MKKVLIFLILAALGVGNMAFAQQYAPTDLEKSPPPTSPSFVFPSGDREYGTWNCDDLTQPISINLGLASSDPGSPERVGTQDIRIFRDGVPSTCPLKTYPGNYNPFTTLGYHAIQFSNCSGEPVCITVSVDMDGGANPCGPGFNSHVHVYQSPDGMDPEPYDPTDMSVNFLGDIGFSGTGSFSVEVSPGFFEVVFTNVYSLSQCDVSFNITVPPGYEGTIRCSCEDIPVANWALLLGVIAIVVYTVIRFRK